MFCVSVDAVYGSWSHLVGICFIIRLIIVCTLVMDRRAAHKADDSAVALNGLPVFLEMRKRPCSIVFCQFLAMSSLSSSASKRVAVLAMLFTVMRKPSLHENRSFIIVSVTSLTQNR